MIGAWLCTVMLAQPPIDAAKPAPSAAVLKLPAQVQAQPGQPFAVIAEGNLKWMRWTIPAGLTRVPVEMTAYGARGFVGYGPAGVYEFRVEGTRDDQYMEAKCVVFIGQPAPTPPGPKPPDPPRPNDPLAAELQSLYDAERSPKKAEYRDTLASIYTTAAAGALRDPAVTTTGQLFAKLRTVSQLLLPDDALRPIRERLAAECRQNFAADAALTDELRAKGCQCFERIAAALAALK